MITFLSWPWNSSTEPTCAQWNENNQWTAVASCTRQPVTLIFERKSFAHRFSMSSPSRADEAGRLWRTLFRQLQRKKIHINFHLLFIHSNYPGVHGIFTIARWPTVLQEPIMSADIICHLQTISSPVSVSVPLRGEDCKREEAGIFYLGSWASEVGHPQWILKFDSVSIIYLFTRKNVLLFEISPLLTPPWKNPLLAPTWKISFRRPCLESIWNNLLSTSLSAWSVDKARTGMTLQIQICRERLERKVNHCFGFSRKRSENTINNVCRFYLQRLDAQGLQHHSNLLHLLLVRRYDADVVGSDQIVSEQHFDVLHDLDDLGRVEKRRRVGFSKFLALRPKHSSVKHGPVATGGFGAGPPKLCCIQKNLL